jgi:hypothetical protein
MQALPLELAALAQAASSLGPPATPAAAAAAAGTDASTAASLNHLLMHSLLKAGAAAVAAAPGISSDVQDSVLPAVQALLCPDVAAAANWYPSWALEAAAHQLLAAAMADGSSSSSAGDADAPASSSSHSSSSSSSYGGGCSAAALSQRDNWRLQQAAEVLEQLALQVTHSSTSSAAAAAGAGVPASDSAVFAALHAFGLLASVLQARPAAVVDFLANSSCSSSSLAATTAGNADAAAAHCAAGSLAECCCAVLTAAVFSLKQRAASPLLPPSLMVPLTKAAVSLLLADAQAKLQLAAGQQQQQQAVSVAVQGLLSLLLSPDAQLRLHSAAALAQACSCSPYSSSSSSSEESASSEGDEPAVASSSSSVPAWRIVFEGVTSAVLQQQSYTAQQLLPAYQAIAEVAASHSSSTEQQQQRQQQQQDLLPVVVQMIVQQLTQWQQTSVHHQPPDVTASWPNAATSSGSSSSAASLQPLAAERLLLLQLLLGHVLAHCSRQLQPTQTPSSNGTSAAATAAHDSTAADATAIAGRADAVLDQVQHVQPALLHLLRMLLPLLQQQDGTSKAGMRHKVSGSSTLQPGPGGWLNYQALLSPSPLLLTWGATQQECGILFAAGSSSSSSVASQQGLSWLLDPTLEGSRGCRLMQGLPLQLAAAAVDLSHTLLSHGLKQAVEQQGELDTWCSVLCGVIDVKALKPVKKLAKRVLTELAGGSAGYKQHRAPHHLQRHAAALLQLLGLDGAADSGSTAAAAAAVQLQANWQQQCAAAVLLNQLLAVAEAQSSCWARVCSSSSMAQLLPLLLQVAVHCRAQQLCLTAVKLFNLALTGAGVNPKAHSSSSSTTTTTTSSSAADTGGSSSSSSQKAGGQRAAGHTAAAQSSSGSPSLDLSWLQLGVHAAAAAASSEQLLLSFASRCVLSWPEPKERKEAAKTLVLLHKALEGVNPSGQLQLLQLVLGLLPAAGAAAGAASLQLFATAAHLVKATPAAAAGSGLSSSSTAGVLSSSRQDVLAAAASQLFGTAVAAAGALATHPYAAAYQQLQQLLDLEPIGSCSSSSSGAAARHWLELSGADVFAAAAGRPAKRGPSSSSRLNNMAAELKFGDRQVCIQCVQHPLCYVSMTFIARCSPSTYVHLPFFVCCWPLLARICFHTQSPP